MLYKDKVCVKARKKFKELELAYLSGGIEGREISLLLPLSQMRERIPEVWSALVGAADTVFKDVDTGEDAEKAEYLKVCYAVGASWMFYGYNAETGDMSLYTSSYRVIEVMGGKDMLRIKKEERAVDIVKDMARYRRVLGMEKIAENFDRGVLQALRLEPVVIGGAVKFNVVEPRGGLDIEKYHIVPMEVMDGCVEVLENALENGIYEVEYSETGKNTECAEYRINRIYMTKSRKELELMYGAELADERLKGAGFNSQLNRYSAVAMGSGIGGTGLRRIPLEDVDNIRRVDISEVDTADIITDMSGVSTWFRDGLTRNFEVIQENLEVLKWLAYGLGLETLESDDLLGKMLEKAERRSGERLLSLVKKEIDGVDLRDLFGLEEYRANNRAKVESGIECKIPQTAEEFGKMLESGAYKVTYIKRDGSVRVLKVTNSADKLAHIYGERYFAKYESVGVRLRRLRDLLNGETSGAEAAADCAYCGMTEMSKEVEESGLVNELKEKIEEKIREIESKRRSSVGENCVTARSLESVGDNGGYYKQIDVGAIMRLVKLF